MSFQKPLNAWTQRSQLLWSPTPVCALRQLSHINEMNIPKAGLWLILVAVWLASGWICVHKQCA